MRLLLASLAIFLAPAFAVLVTVRQVEAIEEEFRQDADSQIARLDRVAALYPPNVRKMRSAPAILQLKEMTGGNVIAANVCGASSSVYQNLFDRLNGRCGEWRRYRRGRGAALLGAVAAIAAFGIVLLCRIAVRRYVERQVSPGTWTMLFIVRGIPLLLFLQLAAAFLGYGVVLQSTTGRLLYTLGILTIPFALLYWLERRSVLAFVEPQVFPAHRSRLGSARRRRLQRTP